MALTAIVAAFSSLFYSLRVLLFYKSLLRSDNLFYTSKCCIRILLDPLPLSSSYILYLSFKSTSFGLMLSLLDVAVINSFSSFIKALENYTFIGT